MYNVGDKFHFKLKNDEYSGSFGYIYDDKDKSFKWLSIIGNEIYLNKYQVDQIVKINNTPNIEWLVPVENPYYTSSDKLKVRAKIISDTPITNVKINFEDGSKVGISELPVVGNIYEFEINVEPNINKKIVLTATNSSGSSQSDRTIIFKSPNYDIVKSKMFVFSVGINDYSDSTISSLKYCASDTRDFIKEMKFQEGALFEYVIIDSLTNKRATTKKIKNSLNSLLSKLNENDLLILHFSMHGEIENNNFYLITHDTKANNLFETAFSENDLRGFIKSVPCSFILFIDACKSGAYITDDNKGFKETSDEEIRNVINGLSDPDKSQLIICSSSSYSSSFENNNWGHGAFTEAIISAIRNIPYKEDINGKNITYLSDKTGNGYLNMSELNDYVINVTRILASNLKKLQNPRSKIIKSTDFNILKVKN